MILLSKLFSRKLSLGSSILSPSYLFFLSIAIAFLYFVAVRFDIQPDRIWTSLKESNPLQLTTAFVLHFTTYILRGAQWRILLANVDHPNRRAPAVLHCSILFLISAFINGITAFHIGDPYRAILIAKKTNRGLIQTLGTLVAERIVDVSLMVILLMLAVVLMLTEGINTPNYFLILTSLLLSVLGLFLITIWVLRTRLLSFVPTLLQGIFLNFYRGTLGSLTRMHLVIFFGILAWLSEIARLYFVSSAMGFNLNFGLITFAALSNAVLTIMPLGGLGFAELGIAELLSQSVSKADAGLIIILDRLISYLSVIVVGSVVFVSYTLFTANWKPDLHPNIIDIPKSPPSENL